MRFSLLPTLGFSLLAVAVIVVVVTGGSSDGRGESLAERRPSTQSFRATTYDNKQPSGFISRSRRERQGHGVVIARKDAIITPAADQKVILSALASSPTTLSAMRPVGHQAFPLKVALPPVSVSTATDAPGNTLLTEDYLVSVKSYRSTPEGNELTVHLTPSQTTSAVTFGSGFTLEEEQFRTKWGWAAFDQVQRTAKYAPSH